MSVERLGLRFELEPAGPQHMWVFTVTRVADGHRIAADRHEAPVADRATLHTLADSWIADRLNAAVPPAVHCSSCGAVLRPVSFDTSNTQFDGALTVACDGGWSMFIDQPPVTLRLCHDCAHTLCDAMPVFAKLLEPHTAHSHDHETAAQLIAAGHRGWDLDVYRLTTEANLRVHLAAKHNLHVDVTLSADELAARHYELHHDDDSCDHDHW